MERFWTCRSSLSRSWSAIWRKRPQVSCTFVCLWAAMWEGKAFTPPLLVSRFVRASALGVIVCFRTSRLDQMLLRCRSGGRITTETSPARSLDAFCIRLGFERRLLAHQRRFVRRRISSRLPGFISLHTAHLLLTRITNKDVFFCVDNVWNRGV